jgi:hypothetical protein
MATWLRAKNGALFEVPALTACAVLPAALEYVWGLSRIVDGVAIFHEGERYERRVPARITTVGQLPREMVVLVKRPDHGWHWAIVCRTSIPEDRFELLELDDRPPSQGTDESLDDVVERFWRLELD